jgi:hypothetical protein
MRYSKEVAIPKLPPPPRPEKIFVFRGACRHEGSVGGDNVDRQNVVAGRPERAHELAIAAAEREAGMPTSESVPPGTAKPNAWVAWSMCPQVRPG